MASQFPTLWNKILSVQGTQNVDLIASLSEDGINNFLTQHHSIDSRLYTIQYKKKLNTQTDVREFTITLDISSPIQVQFPPYKDPNIAREFRDTSKWYAIDNGNKGPELTALETEANKIQVYCNEVNISIEWPKLHPVQGSSPNWKFTLKPLQVFAEAYAVLKNDGSEYFITVIPTTFRFDAPTTFAEFKKSIKSLKAISRPEIQALDECQEKFTDLLVIAFNFLATQQAPKLVQNIKIPAISVKDKPIYPTLLNISDNCLTIGAGIDKNKVENIASNLFEKEFSRLSANMQEDIDAAGGLLKLVSKNPDEANSFEEIEIKNKKEIDALFKKTNNYLESLQARMESANHRPISKIRSRDVVKDAFGVGVNEYLLYTVLNAVMPTSRNQCSDWLDLALGRGRACYWMRFYGLNVSVNQNASITGSVQIDVGGGLEACIRKFWDCSWKWACSSIGLSVRGTPEINIKLLSNANGVSILPSISGRLFLDAGLPWPFDKVLAAFTSIIFSFVEAGINIILAGISFVILYPTITLPQQITKIKLRDFSISYYPRPVIPGVTPPKSKFLAISCGLVAER